MQNNSVHIYIPKHMNELISVLSSLHNLRQLDANVSCRDSMSRNYTEIISATFLQNLSQNANIHYTMPQARHTCCAWVHALVLGLESVCLLVYALALLQRLSTDAAPLSFQGTFHLCAGLGGRLLCRHEHTTNDKDAKVTMAREWIQPSPSPWPSHMPLPFKYHIHAAYLRRHAHSFGRVVASHRIYLQPSQTLISV